MDNIEYWDGNLNTVADALSRYNVPDDSTESKDKTILSSISIGDALLQPSEYFAKQEEDAGFQQWISRRCKDPSANIKKRANARWYDRLGARE